MEPNSIEEVTATLVSWTRHAGPGMALVQFSSEPARRRVLHLVRQGTKAEVPELSFPGSGDVELDVRDLVDRLTSASSSIVSIRGFEDVFPMGIEREKAIDLLNFLRESIARFAGRQIWWFTFDSARLLRERAPDWLSWFTPKLELHEAVPIETPDFAALGQDSASLVSARARLDDAFSRIHQGLSSGARSADLWAGLAYPALFDLHRTGALAEESSARENLLDLLYGPGHDAARMVRIRQDLDLLMKSGSYPAAAFLAGEGMDLTIEGASPERNIEAWRSVGNIYREAGRYAEAEGFLELALTESERQFGADHPATLDSLNDLALVYKSQDHFDKAEPLYDRALAMSTRMFGADHPSTLVVMNNLAALYVSQGRHREAEPLFVRALRVQERVLGRNHLSTLVSVGNLATLYASQGRAMEAESLHLRALSGTEQLLGARHPDTLRTINNLAVLYEQQGLYDKAEPLFGRALSGRERVLGSDHPDTLTTVYNLAGLYQSQQRFDDAERLYLRALEAAKRVMPTDYELPMKIANNLAALYQGQGREQRAEELYLRALAGAEKKLGPNHPDTALLRRNLATLRTHQQ